MAVSQQVKQIFLKTVRLSYQESPATKDLPLSPSLQSPVHIPTRTPVHTPVHQPGMDNSLSATQVDQQTLLKALVHSRKENAMLQDRVADLEDDIWKMRKATTEEINFLRDSLDQLVKVCNNICTTYFPGAVFCFEDDRFHTQKAGKSDRRIGKISFRSPRTTRNDRTELGA